VHRTRPVIAPPPGRPPQTTTGRGIAPPAGSRLPRLLERTPWRRKISRPAPNRSRHTCRARGRRPPFGEFFTPDEGARDIAVEITVRGGDGAIEANPNDFGLQTTDGYFYGPAFVSRDITTADIPDLETIEVSPGTETTGLVIYAVPQEAELARLLWQPDNGRLLVVADLR